MTGESHIEAMVQGIAGSQPAGESHLKFALTGGTPPACGESHILAGAALAMPPAMLDILYWFDAGDPSTLWQDDAGTVPAVNTVAMKRIDNKGSDIANVPFLNDDLIAGSAPPIYLLNEPLASTGAIGVKTGSMAWSIDVNPSPPFPPAGPAAGITMAAVGRQNDTAVANTSVCNWGSSFHIHNDGDGNVSAGNWVVRSANVSADTGVATTAGTWNYCYFAHAGTNLVYRVGGAAEASVVHQNYSPINAGQNITMSGFRAQWAEFIIWNRQLTAPERAAVTAYFDAKYPTLPF